MEGSPSPAHLRGKPGQGAQVSVVRWRGSPGAHGHLEGALVELVLVMQRLSCCPSIWKGKLGVRVARASPCAGEVLFMDFTVRATFTVAPVSAY